MIIVIIAGGSGTRLWPLSQSNYPKHLLKLTGETSLLQNTVERAKALTTSVYVVPEQSHIDEVRAQLPGVPDENILVEPGRRGTASCFVLAIATIMARGQGEEPVVFLWADHHITNDAEFEASVRTAAEASARERKITLVGVHPTYPATGFEYIKRGAPLVNTANVLEVTSFEERPDAKVAKRYVESGDYYWNMGLFAAPASVFVEAFAAYAPELNNAYKSLSAVINDSARLNAAYLELADQKIDMALIKKDPSLLVVPGKFDWADIGSYFDLHKILQGSDKNSLKGDIELIDCEDVMVHASGTKPIVVIGLKGVVVVDSPDGLLVCVKEKSQLVGEAAKKLAARAKKSS